MVSLCMASLPETSLHCTQAPHFFKCLFYLRGRLSVVVQAALCCLHWQTHILVVFDFSVISA